jgi:hypothetical protein
MAGGRIPTGQETAPPTITAMCPHVAQAYSFGIRLQSMVTAGAAASWTPPGVKAGFSNSSPVWAITQPPRLPRQPLHPLASELPWRTAIRAGCGGPWGRPAGRRPQPAWSAPPAGHPDCRGEETCAGGAANSSTGEVTCSAGRSWWACFGMAVSSWSSFLAMPHTYHTGGIGRDHHLNLYRNRDTSSGLLWPGVARWPGAWPGPSR